MLEVKVGDQSMDLDAKPVRSVKLNQKPYAKMLTGKVVETYLLHDCPPDAQRASGLIVPKSTVENLLPAGDGLNVVPTEREGVAR